MILIDSVKNLYQNVTTVSNKHRRWLYDTKTRQNKKYKRVNSIPRLYGEKHPECAR